MDEVDLREIGRKLGYDIASYGVELWDDATKLLGVVEGYASRRGEPSVRQDEERRFVRKWVQLRVSALHRGKVVDPKVTPEFLREIDYPTCPVTLESLTHAAREDTDWSIDRVNNSAGYAVGNLVVMSRRANEAKGSKTLCEAVDLARGQTEVQGLTPKQWLRLASLMLGPYAVEERRLIAKHATLPLATRIPRLSVRSYQQQFQRLLLDAAKDFQAFRFVKKHLPDAFALARKWTDVEVMIELIRRRLASCEYPYDALVHEDLQLRRVQFFLALSPRERENVQAFVKTWLGGKVSPRESLGSWSLESRGLLI